MRSGEMHLVLRLRKEPPHVSAGQPVGKWEVEFPKRWYGIDYWYGEGISDAITMASYQGLRTTTFVAEKTQIRYLVDLERMTQQNEESGRIRRIRFVGAKEPVRDVLSV